MKRILIFITLGISTSALYSMESVPADGASANSAATDDSVVLHPDVMAQLDEILNAAQEAGNLSDSIINALPKTVEERLDLVERRVDALEQTLGQFATHEEYVNLADGMAGEVQRLEEKFVRHNQRPEITDASTVPDTAAAEGLDSAHDNRKSMKNSRGVTFSAKDEADALLNSNAGDEDGTADAQPTKQTKGSSASSFESSMLSDLAPQIGTLNLTDPSVAGALALVFHLMGGKNRIKDACGTFNEPTRKAVAQLVEGAVLANVFNATWPKISNGEPRNGWVYTALFVSVHVGAKLLKPYILKQLGSKESDSDMDSDTDQKGFIKDLKNNIEWGPLLAQAAIAYALTPLLMGK
jgi:hypothetical protein